MSVRRFDQVVPMTGLAGKGVFGLSIWIARFAWDHRGVESELLVRFCWNIQATTPSGCE